jgi:lysophospholipase L1-like esterase
MRRRRLAALAIATMLAEACSGSSTGPTPPPPAPQIVCADAIAIDDVITLAQAVTYAAPTASGGAPPVTVACAPQSGAEFPIGETLVTCTATDVQSRQASCSFVVTLRHRLVALTRFLAFGDSITAGENGRLFGFVPFIDVDNAYPTFLQQLFSERMPAQQIVVVNAGLPGEKVADNDSRLKGEIARNRSEVLLLLEGINDLSSGASPQNVVNALRDNIRVANDRGTQYVFVSTLLPVAPENCGPAPLNCRGLSTNNTVIATTNQGFAGWCRPTARFWSIPTTSSSRTVRHTSTSTACTCARRAIAPSRRPSGTGSCR